MSLIRNSIKSPDPSFFRRGRRTCLISFYPFRPYGGSYRPSLLVVSFFIMIQLTQTSPSWTIKDFSVVKFVTRVLGDYHKFSSLNSPIFDQTFSLWSTDLLDGETLQTLKGEVSWRFTLDRKSMRLLQRSEVVQRA